MELGGAHGGIDDRRIDSAPTAVSNEVSLADRPVAYSVISELLRQQDDSDPRGALRRILGVSPLHVDAESWFSGAHGELKVGALLSKLGDEWTVLHAVPVGTGDSDVDHVLVGPAGVFTINTKRHRGKKIWVSERMLMISGQKTDHLRNSRHEAKRPSKLLSAATGMQVDAHPILAIVDPAGFTFKQRPKDVSIMDARALPRCPAASNDSSPHSSLTTCKGSRQPPRRHADGTRPQTSRSILGISNVSVHSTGRSCRRGVYGGSGLPQSRSVLALPSSTI